MVNDLVALNASLDLALNDAADTVWTSAEKNEIINWAVDSLWPRVSRPLDPDSTAIALDDDVFFYPLPSDVMAVSRVDWLEEDGYTEHGQLSNGSWSVEGNVYDSTGVLRVDPYIVAQGGVLRLYGYARYDTVNYLLPRQFIPEVLAVARAEAYRRLVGDRARFKAWLSRQQTQNTSVNELTQLVNDADGEARRLRVLNKVWMRPVPGRA